MIYYIGAGSNLGDRHATLLKALALIKKEMAVLKIAPLFDNPPLLPENAPDSWYSVYTNTVFKVEWPSSPDALLATLKKIEQLCGRTQSERWAPRVLDLDILTSEDETTHSALDLHIPHPQVLNRSFTLNPLCHLAPQLKIQGRTVLDHLQTSQKSVPYLMAALNCTPDSFSRSTKEASPLEQFQQRLSEHTAIIDLGAESTRHGATPVTSQEEIERLRPLLEMWKAVKNEHPWSQVSIDTRHAATARFALDHGVNILNDVEHLQNPELLEIAPHFDHVVFMHSLSVPADKHVVMPQTLSVVEDLKNWCFDKLEGFSNIPKEKLIFDPGIGFSKTPVQSLRILQNLDIFRNLPVRLLVGHSRKSFMNLWSKDPYAERDLETFSVALALANTPIHILRVHNTKDMARTLLSYQCVKNPL